MNSFKEKYGPWALVTGASRVIGKQYAIHIAIKGSVLFLLQGAKKN